MPGAPVGPAVVHDGKGARGASSSFAPPLVVPEPEAGADLDRGLLAGGSCGRPARAADVAWADRGEDTAAVSAVSAAGPPPSRRCRSLAPTAPRCAAKEVGPRRRTAVRRIQRWAPSYWWGAAGGVDGGGVTGLPQRYPARRRSGGRPPEAVAGVGSGGGMERRQPWGRWASRRPLSGGQASRTW